MVGVNADPGLVSWQNEGAGIADVDGDNALDLGSAFGRPVLGA